MILILFTNSQIFVTKKYIQSLSFSDGEHYQELFVSVYRNNQQVPQNGDLTMFSSAKASKNNDSVEIEAIDSFFVLFYIG